MKEETAGILACLRAAAASGGAAFVRAVDEVSRERFSAAMYAEAVRLALEAGAHMRARTLAAEGARRYPEDEELAKMARILARPDVLDAARPADASVSANQEWLRRHANEYRGRWVALRTGRLLADAPTAKELKSKLKDRSNLLVTKVA